MSKATLRVHPRHAPILDAEFVAIILSGRIGMKVPLNVRDAHEAILRDMTKGIGNGRIAEGRRVGRCVEASSCVVGRNTNLNLREASGHEDIRSTGKRCLIGNINLGDSASAILIRVFEHCIDRRIKSYRGRMDWVKNLGCTHLCDLMIRIKSHSGIVASYMIERDDGGI